MVVRRAVNVCELGDMSPCIRYHLVNCIYFSGDFLLFSSLSTFECRGPASQRSHWFWLCTLRRKSLRFAQKGTQFMIPVCVYALATVPLQNHFSKTVFCTLPNEKPTKHIVVNPNNNNNKCYNDDDRSNDDNDVDDDGRDRLDLFTDRPYLEVYYELAFVCYFVLLFIFIAASHRQCFAAKHEMERRNKKKKGRIGKKPVDAERWLTFDVALINRLIQVNSKPVSVNYDNDNGIVIMTMFWSLRWRKTTKTP